MSYSNNPEQDAARQIDAVAKDDEARQALRSAIRDDIRTAFNEHVRVVGPSNVPLKHPVYMQTVLEAAQDLIMVDKIGDMFAAVLHLSNCPYVQAMREAMAKEYDEMWGDDLVEGEM